jgi:hypothetical protein
MIDREESIYLLKKVIPISVKGEKWIIEVSLEDTVGAIQRAIRHGIDHMVPATDMIGSPWARLQTSPIKMGNEKIFFPDPNRIGRRRKMPYQSPFILNPFNRNIGHGLEDVLRDRIILGLFVEINFLNLKGEHH